MKKLYTVRGVDETEALGKTIAAALESDPVLPKFVALYGEMGVGKTAFVRGFASHFGIPNVKSPTYTILNEYRGRARIFHYDFYRISDADDLCSVGYDDTLRVDAYILAEWSERVPDELPAHRLNVSIRRTDEEDGRAVEVEQV